MNERKKAKIFGNLFKDAYHKLNVDERKELIECLLNKLDIKVEQRFLEINEGLDKIIKKLKEG